MSSVSSAEPTAQNFNPSWMRPNAAANRGGSISSGGTRLSGTGGGFFDDGGDENSSSINAAVLSQPVVSEFSYTRERLLELAPTGSIMHDAMRNQAFFTENVLPPVSSTPLTELEQKLQHNINSSKAMSLLSHSDRASIAAGAAYGSGYGGGIGSPSIQNGQSSTTNRWTPKSAWSKSPAERPVGGTTRGGGSVGRTAGTFFAGRGASRVGSENGSGGSINGGSQTAPADEPAGPFQPKFMVRRGGGAGSVGRGGSTTGASFNTRADALYNPNDPTDRPKAVNVAATRSESDDEEEEGWSKVGATNRSSTNSVPTSSERPAWVRSESWMQRTQQQQQQNSQQQSQPPTSNWNSNKDSGADSAAWRDRNQMMAAVKKTSGDNSSPPLQSQASQQSSAPTSAPPREDMDHGDVGHVPMSSYQPNPSTWSNNSMSGMSVFFQPNMASGPASAASSAPVPVAKEELVEFYYMDPTETRRGPFHKDQMMVWFKAGYFTDETLRVQRGEKGEYKTIGDLKKLHGVTTPFDYPEDIEKPNVPVPPPTSIPNMPSMSSYPSTSNPMFPSAPYGGMNMWSSMVQPNDMLTMMQTTFEQQMIAERHRLAEEHSRRMQEETEKIAKFQEAMYRQLTLQQEMSQQQIREQELALQRHREELEKRDAELKREALARQHQMEMEARELEQRKSAIEAEDRRKREHDEQVRRMYEERQKEAAAREIAEQLERKRMAHEAAERESLRLAEESRKAEELIRQQRLKREQELRENEEKKKVAEKERHAREQAELEAVWTSKKVPVVSTASAPVAGAPKQVSPTGSDDSEGWTPISKEVKHTKAAPWASKAAEAPQKSEKTLLEIQLEEERKMKAEQEQNAKKKVKEQSSVTVASTSPEKTSALWGATKTWAAPESNSSSKSYVSPFLDGPSLEAANKMALQKKNSQAKIAVPKPAAAKQAAPAKTKPAQPPAEKPKKSKEQAAADDLELWFTQKFRTFSVHVDVTTLFACIMTLENPNEVEDIVMSYLDESKTVKEFVREFIKRRIAMRAAGGVAHPDADDLTSARAAAAAPSDSNSGSNSNSGNGQGKKKKKTTKQVLDGNILGFRGAAASDRLNKGEIDAIPTAPVNPSRR